MDERWCSADSDMRWFQNKINSCRYYVAILHRAGIDCSFIYSQLDPLARKQNINRYGRMGGGGRGRRGYGSVAMQSCDVREWVKKTGLGYAYFTSKMYEKLYAHLCNQRDCRSRVISKVILRHIIDSESQLLPIKVWYLIPSQIPQQGDVPAHRDGRRRSWCGHPAAGYGTSKITNLSVLVKFSARRRFQMVTRTYRWSTCTSLPSRSCSCTEPVVSPETVR